MSHRRKYQYKSNLLQLQATRSHIGRGCARGLHPPSLAPGRGKGGSSSPAEVGTERPSNWFLVLYGLTVDPSWIFLVPHQQTTKSIGLCWTACINNLDLPLDLNNRHDLMFHMQPYLFLWPPYVMGGIIFLPCSFLWSPYVLGQTIIFLPCDFYLSSFFPRLISAATDWMSTILLHMAWP